MSPSEIVSAQYSQAVTYASQQVASVTSFLNALSNVTYATPTIDITWTPIETPATIATPAAPASFSTLETEFQWDTNIDNDKPADFALADPTITIDDFTEVAPTTTFDAAPTLDFGTRPTVPEVATITVPDAPTIDVIAAPSLLSLSVPTFAGVDTHEGLQATMTELQTLELVAPTPYSHNVNPEYTSALIDALRTTLESRLSGGTGLPAAAEDAIWDRARDREANAAQANVDQVTRTSEALGFALPAGVLAAQVLQAQVDYYDKVSSLSRDIAIKQAELEQANLEKSIAAGLDLEGKLIDHSYRMEQLAFENAKTVAENAIQIHNARVEKFRATLQSYEAYRQAYMAVIEAERLVIQELEAKIRLEQAKADFNRSNVAAYQAQIEAGLSRVKIYEGQIEGAKALMQLESTKLAAVGEEIKAYVAGINGETAKVEAYKASVQAEATKVEVYGAKARAYAAKVSGQEAKARAQLSLYQARVGAYQAQWDGFRARIGAEAERFRALSAKSSAILDGYKANIENVKVQFEQNAELFRASVAQYSAQQNYSLSGAQINTNILQANRAALQEVGKVGAQVHAQLAASALHMVQTSASISGSGSTSVSYSYGNDTDSTAPTVTTA